MKRMEFAAFTIVAVSLCVPSTSSAANCLKLYSKTKPTSPPLFQNDLDSARIVEFNMHADFKLAKAKSPTGNWTGEDRSYSEFGVPFTISGAGPRDVTGQIKTRGMSSVETAAFPKLKVKLDKNQDLNQSLFQHIKGFRINTSGFHNDSRAPFREALAYEMAETLGLKTPKTQRARIGYFQTDPTMPVERLPNETQALLIENDSSTMERLGVSDFSMDYIEGKPGLLIDTQASSEFFMFHSLILNDDVGLRVRSEPTMFTEKYRPLFNTVVFRKAHSEALTPLVYDLDKSGVVDPKTFSKGRKSLLLNRFVSGNEGEMVTSLSRLRQRFTRHEIEAATKKFKDKLPQLEKLVASRAEVGLVDQEGAATAQALIRAFRKLSGEFLDPRITLKPTHIYRRAKEDPKLSLLPMDFSDEPAPLRPGTPIKILKKTADGRFFKVVILDTRHDIPSSSGSKKTMNEYIGYIKADTPIGEELPESDLGYTNDFDMAW